MADTQRIIAWRGGSQDIAPVRCECVGKFGYPNECITPEGMRETMYDNRHFKTPQEAWARITKNADTNIEMAGHDVHYAKKELAKAQVAAADAVENYTLVMNHPDNPFKKTD